jgi:hypothetical protein
MREKKRRERIQKLQPLIHGAIESECGDLPTYEEDRVAWNALSAVLLSYIIEEADTKEAQDTKFVDLFERMLEASDDQLGDKAMGLNN